jgi:hypothetical protein
VLYAAAGLAFLAGSAPLLRHAKRAAPQQWRVPRWRTHHRMECLVPLARKNFPPSTQLLGCHTSVTACVRESSARQGPRLRDEDNFVDSDERRIDGECGIDVETLMPFLDTFDCLGAKVWVYLVGEGSTDTWAEAARFKPDPSSLHGVYVPWETSHTLRMWQIEEAGHYGLTAEHCLEEMTLHVYDPSGLTKPVASEARTAPTCPALP